MTADVEEYHAELAAKFGVRLPRRNSAPQTANQARFLRQLGLTWGALYETTGERRGEYFPLNPERNLRDRAGEVLEMLSYMGFRR